MYNVKAPPFPEFTDDEYSHLTSIRLPAFSGMQITNGPYGAVSSPERSTGETHAAADRPGGYDSRRCRAGTVPAGG